MPPHTTIRRSRPAATYGEVANRSLDAPGNSSREATWRRIDGGDIEPGIDHVEGKLAGPVSDFEDGAQVAGSPLLGPLVHYR